MPSKSKAQQRFMGMVNAYKKGELKGSEVSKDVKDAAKGMKKKDTKKYASTKHKGLPNKVKKEELKRLIAKYGAKRGRETVMAVRPKAVTVSGNRMPEDPDFEYDPEKVTDEGFGGELKGKDKDKFEKARIENAEQLGYKATGTSDTKKQKLKMAHELKEVSNPTSGIMMAHKKKKKHKHNEGSFKTTLRPQKKDINKMKVRFKSDPRRVYTLKSVETGRVGGTSYMFAAPGNRKERFTPKTWDLANKKGWLSLESVSEGKKRYYQQDRVGSAKYTISYHDGKKKHKDGSDFFDIQTFRNKKDLAKFVNALHRGGYKYGFGESVNERLYVPSKFDKALDRLKFNQFTPNNIKRLAKKFKVDYKDAVEFIKQNKVINVANKPTMAEASKEAMGIAGFTGTRGVAVDDFIKKHKIDARKLFNFVKKGNLRDRMDFVTAIAGKPNNKFFKMIVGRFAESVNEDKNKESKVIQVMYKYAKTEKKFYDKLADHERRLGQRQYQMFIGRALQGFGLKNFRVKSIPDAEEKLYQTVSK